MLEPSFQGWIRRWEDDQGPMTASPLSDHGVEFVDTVCSNHPIVTDTGEGSEPASQPITKVVGRAPPVVEAGYRIHHGIDWTIRVRDEIESNQAFRRRRGSDRGLECTVTHGTVRNDVRFATIGSVLAVTSEMPPLAAMSKSMGRPTTWAATFRTGTPPGV